MAIALPAGAWVPSNNTVRLVEAWMALGLRNFDCSPVYAGEDGRGEWSYVDGLLSTDSNDIVAIVEGLLEERAAKSEPPSPRTEG
jgi:hypothetical protein